jgi:tricorn protease
MKHAFVLAGLCLALAAGHAQAQPTLLLSQPDLSAENLAFVYAGDIWITNRDGSAPRRLTSGMAEENTPLFSPDGSKVAFQANPENNGDVYVVDTAGGQPQRLTWHPGQDVPTGWTADGKSVTVVSSMETDHGRSGQLYHVAVAGGLPQKRMEARIIQGVYDAADARLAFLSVGPGYNGLFGGSAGWRGYQGGATPAMHIMDLKAQSVATIEGPRSTNFNPMWIGEDLYFLSDRVAKTFNIFRYRPATRALTQVTREPTWDVRAAGAHGNTIAYEAGGRIKLLDVSSGQAKDLSIEIRPDLPQLRTQWKDATKMVHALDLSPTGKRAILTARGEVFTVPLEKGKGSIRNVSNTPTREYTAIWSPDGKQIAYIAATNGSQNLVIEDQTGAGEKRTYPLGSLFYALMDWSAGDDPRIAFQDNHLTLHTIQLKNGAISKVATGVRRDDIEAVFTPDGRWLAYTVERANFNRDLVLRELSSGKDVPISDGLADTASPAFSRDGKYLYFTASTNSGPTQIGLNMSSQERPYRAGIYAVVLAADGKSPLLPKRADENDGDEGDKDKGKEESQEESADKTTAKKDKADKAEKKDDAAQKLAQRRTRIDADGIQSRVVALPVPERNYRSLAVQKDGKLVYLQVVQPGVTNELPEGNAQSANELLRFDFEKKEAKRLHSGAQGFVMSESGSHVLIRKFDEKLEFAKLEDKDTLEFKPLELGGLKVRVEPRQEWAQIFEETWRMEREYFYDPNLHGLDWKGVWDRYRPMLDHVGRREDLNDLMVMMIAEMQVGHNRVGGGDIHREEGTNTGLLGANYRIENGRYRLTKVYTGETWNPFLKAPLATPGNGARAGEYILAIDGQELTAADNIFERMQGTKGKLVSLRVGPQADGRNARDIMVEPIDNDRELRLWSWIEANRRAVSQATGGRVGYVYLPNTAGAGYTLFNRMFFAQLDKEAMIIDERANGGGQAANYIVETLARRHLSGWKDRDGEIYNTPEGAMHGPKVMLIDQDAGSGGDFLPYSFRQLGIGKLIGTRTWGGLIGISANPALMDGGNLTVPFFRFFDAQSRWTVENEGVAPDLEVVLDPIATNNGRDSQLEAAIADVMSQLKTHKDSVPRTAPPLPKELGK